MANAAMNPSSIAIRACTNTVKLKSVTAAAIAAVRARPQISHAIANTPGTTALAASVDITRQPKLLSPNSTMPSAISSLPSSGCSVLRAPASVSSIRAAGT